MSENDVKNNTEEVQENKKAVDEAETSHTEEVKSDVNQSDKEDTSKSKDEESKKEKKNKYMIKIEKLEKENKELKNQSLMMHAELENFKRRTIEEKNKDIKYASLGLIQDLLVGLDNLNKVVNMPTEDPTLKNFLIGFKMINNQMFQSLEADGLKAIDALNHEFDPKFHQAIGTVETDEVQPGIVVEELQRGYTYKERLVRPSMVKVSKEISKKENE